MRPLIQYRDKAPCGDVFGDGFVGNPRRTAMVGFTATGSYDGDSNVVSARSIDVVLKQQLRPARGIRRGPAIAVEI